MIRAASNFKNRSPPQIPSFSLYGELPAVGSDPNPVHIEDIQSRSSKYQWSIKRHRHTSLDQCVFVTAGPATAVLDDVQTDFDGAAVIIIPAGTAHGFRFGAGTQGHVLTVSLDALLGMATAAHQGPIQKLFAVPRSIDLRTAGALVERIGHLMAILAREFRNPDQPVAPVCSWLAACILGILAHENAAEGNNELHCNRENERLRRFRMLIESHYLHHWAVKRYAHQLGLSETSLNRICRRLCGRTAFYLVQHRLALAAKHRLIHHANSVSGVASELGFKDPAYFCRFFRRHTGVSPNDFRRQVGG